MLCRGCLHLHLFMCLSGMLIGVVGVGWLEIFAGRLFGSMVLWVGSGDVICCGVVLAC